MTWTAGEPAPLNLYRTTDGRLAESVVLSDPHEVLATEGEVLTEEQAAEGRQFEAQSTPATPPSDEIAAEPTP